MITLLLAEGSEDNRAHLLAALGADAQIEVVGVASCGADALSMTKRLRPSLVMIGGLVGSRRSATRWDARETTSRIMAEAPTPIVAVIPVENELQAKALLSVGAVAVCPYPTSGRGYQNAQRALIETVRTMSAVKVVGNRRRSNRPEIATRIHGGYDIVAVAASTGGPHALTRLLKPLPRDFPVPVVIVQHLAAGFVAGFARWLDEHCAIEVKLVERAEPLRPGVAYVAADGAHLRVLRRSVESAHEHGRWPFLLSPSEGPPEGGFCPSASVLFESVATAFGARALAVILTGMGRDGVSGLSRVREKGGCVIAQDEQTSIVFGMPSVAIQAGLTDIVLPIDRMARQIQDLVRAKESP